MEDATYRTLVTEDAVNADGVEAGAQPWQSYPFLIGRFVSSNTLAALRYFAGA